ncbi:TIGR03086 family metal-binding protein [Gordonia caeni]|uniref:TIGR03086 family metal-binding protein n=1 Tax=Gordonia caeni TaxID=1007097 RepID=A0ABP7PUD4_9ACTN
MSWDALQTYDNGLDFFGAVVHAVPADRWGRPSPCAGWSALDVLGHVGLTTAVGATILRGETVTVTPVEPPSSAVSGDPVVWWDGLQAQAHAALTSVDDLDRVIDSPAGPRTVREGLSFPAADLYMHGWDLATATGRDLDIPAEAIEFISGMFADIPDEITRRPGVFGPPVSVPEDASPTATLMAFAGRDPGR